LKITEIRIKLMEESEDRLRAFCSITLDDCFVVRDLKIIDGSSGPFVAMPSRKLTNNCHRCRHKNQARANYCNYCGAKQRTGKHSDHDAAFKLYADVAHPINSDCREMIQNAVLEEFEQELTRSQEPGYRSRYDDEFSHPEAVTRKFDPPETRPPKPHLTTEAHLPAIAEQEPEQETWQSHAESVSGAEPTTSDLRNDSSGFPVSETGSVPHASPQRPNKNRNNDSSSENHRADDTFGKGIF
jgi:stage V sporulation protein G